MLLDYLYEAEKALRELATAKQLNRDIKYQQKLAEKAADRLHKARYECYQLSEAIENFPYMDCYLVEKIEMAPFIEPKKTEKLSDAAKEYIRAVCDEIEGRLRLKCAYRASESDASYINDLASCLHRVIEDIEKHIGKRIPETRKCYASKDANPVLVEICKEWDYFAERSYARGLYSEEDYEALFAHLGKEEGIFRVGSAAGHATHINLKEKKVEYYDDDRVVNRIMKKLFEEKGMSCSYTPEGIECKFEKLNPREVAKTLAAATSMDLRLENPCGDPGHSRDTLCGFAREKLGPTYAEDLETWFWSK